MVISDLLIAAICVAALFQPTKQRFLIALVFAISCAAHAMFSGGLSDVNYYVSAGVADVVVIFIIAIFSDITRFSDLMISACGVSLFINLYGMLMYSGGIFPGSYDAAFVILYVAVLVVFIKRGKDEGYWHDWLCLPYLKRISFCNSLYKKA